MKAKRSAGKKVLPAPGVHVARLIAILDYGKQVDSYDPDGRDKVEFVWELPEELHVFNEDKGEQPLVVDRKFGNTLGRGSKLKDAIEGMIGTKIKPDFEFDSLKYELCQLTLDIEDDGEYKNVIIKSFSPLGKEQLKKKYPHFNDWIMLDLSTNEDETSNFDQESFDALPQWKKDNIAKSPDFKLLEAEGIAVNVKEGESKQPPAKKAAPPPPAAKSNGKAATPFAKAAGKGGVKAKK